MKIFILNKFTSVRKEDGTLISYSSMKLLGYLFTKWKNGNFQERYLPSVRKTMADTGLSNVTIQKSLNELRSVRINDKYGNSCSLLKIEDTVNKYGEKTKIYRIAFPEHGYEDPENFSQKGGGDATLSVLGGYFTIDEDIQALNLPAGQELVLAAMANILSFSKDTKIPDFLFNTSMFANYGKFEGMNREHLKKLIRGLRDKGIFKAEVVRKGKFWGWKNIELITNKDISQMEERNEAAIVEQEEEEMDTYKQQMMIEKAMEAGNMDLATKLTDAMTAFLNGREKPTEAPVENPQKKAEKKPKKRDAEELDFQNDYIKVYLRVPKNIAKNSTITGMIKGLKESLAYNWQTADDVEASGYKEGLKEYNVSMSYEILQEAPKVEYEPETLEDVIEKSKAESDAYFDNEPVWVDRTIKVIEETGVLNKQPSKPQPEPEQKQEEPKEKVYSPEQIAFMEQVEREKAETRKKRMYQLKQEQEAEFDELVAII